MIQTHEIMAWLGPAADEMTKEQIADFTRIILAWESDHPDADPDDADTAAAWTVAHMAVMGTLNLVELAGEDLRAQAEARKTRAQLRLATLAAIAAGMSEAEAERQTGITRMTVRAWRGKR